MIVVTDGTSLPQRESSQCGGGATSAGGGGAAGAGAGAGLGMAAAAAAAAAAATAAMDFPKVPSLLEGEEWTYTMRRTMQEIVPGLFLGPYSAAMRSKLEVLLQHGVTHIVCVRQDIEAHFIRPNFPDRFKYLILDIADNVTENIIQHFGKVRAFVDEALAQGGKALVHGNAGISRSAALVLAYIMEKYGLSCNCAFYLVQQRRFCINPNEGFMAQLAEFEPIYKAQRTLQNGQCSHEKSRNKRRIDQVDECTSLDMVESELQAHDDEMEVGGSS